MSETPDNEFAPGFPERLKEIIRGGAVILEDWNNAEIAPDACQSEDNGSPAVVTLPQQTHAEIAVSGAMQARIAPNGEYIPLGAVWSEQEQKIVPMQLVVENLDTVMRACNKADDEAHATGTEAQVCADIARRQRRGLAKYGKTVIANNLSFAQWLQHFYEELLDGAIYAKRILTQMNHEPENEKQPQDDSGADGVLHRDPSPHHGVSDTVPLRASTGAGHDSDFCPGPVARHRKPGAGRKPKPCPNCGATKSIGSTVKNGIPTRRCKACGFVVQTYPHLANAAKAPA